MATTIKLKNSVTTTNAPSSLVQGEVAINITDKKVWVGNAATTPIQLLGDGGSASFTSIAFGAGTVSNPSITFTGDTNTGIYSPAADTIAFTEGGVEAMRIDSSGNVGIGSTSPLSKLEVVGGQFRVANTSTAAVCIISTDSTSTNGVTVESSYYGGAGYGPMKFNTGGSERMRITSNGRLLVGTTTENTSGGVLQVSNGITFPATQSASSDANTLDDYEEGTWTPTNSIVALTSNSGRYTKIGRVVQWSCAFTIPSTANTTSIKIDGLPFTCANDQAARAGSSVGYTNANSTFTVMVDTNSTSFYFYSYAGANLTLANLSSSLVYCGGTYTV